MRIRVEFFTQHPSTVDLVSHDTGAAGPSCFFAHTPLELEEADSNSASFFKLVLLRESNSQSRAPLSGGSTPQA